MGVPAELSGDEDSTLCSVKNMLGYGRYDQPPGTWSDDTSLTLCTMESLIRGYDLEDMGRTFCTWLFESKWTPAGYVFDAGLTTFMALDSLCTEHKSAHISGCATEDDNGNGSLMRILPAALYFSPLPVPQFLERIHEISAITHAHPRSQLGCGLYALIVRALLDDPDRSGAFNRAMTQASEYYNPIPSFQTELHQYARIVSGNIATAAEGDVHSSGYIVDTLESALWCFLHHDTVKETLLAAVRMGLETDTTGMIAGGLAGIACATTGPTTELIATLVRKDEIDAQIEAFVYAAITNSPAT